MPVSQGSIPSPPPLLGFTYKSITLCALHSQKGNNKDFCVIDPLNKQHIAIREESHDWPKYNLQLSYSVHPSPHLLTFLKLMK